MRTFVVADLHFGDEATCTRYRKPDGSPLRPFASAAEMDAEIISRWNQTVTERDLVYVLGDLGARSKCALHEAPSGPETPNSGKWR